MLYLILAALLVALDQAVKFLVRAHIPLGGSLPVLPGVLDLTYVQNTGAAFSLFTGHTWLLTIISLAVSVALAAALVKGVLRHPFARCALAVVLALVVVIVAAWKSLFIRPDLSPKPSADSEETEEIDWGEGTRPRSDGERKSEDYYTVLILGRDTGGGGNTDTMLLASYDVTNQKATVMSIPRDTMVNIPYDIKRINAVYNYGGGGDKGLQYLYKEISQLVGFEPDYQVVVEWEAVGEIVDAMGGVWFDVPRNMNYDDPYQDLSIHIEKGYQLLDGEGAMGVLRYRHDNDLRYGYPDGDLGRIKTQQAFLQAMVEQLLKVKNVTKINEFIKVFQDNVETDLSFQNILWFAQAAVFGGLSIDNVNFVTMPNKNVSCWSRSYHSYQSYVTPIANELLDLVNNELSPYVEQFTLSDLDIMSVNSDGSVSSSTGYVEDSKAASPPVTSSGSGGGSTTAKPEENQPVTDENGNVGYLTFKLKIKEVFVPSMRVDGLTDGRKATVLKRCLSSVCKDTYVDDEAVGEEVEVRAPARF